MLALLSWILSRMLTFTFTIIVSFHRATELFNFTKGLQKLFPIKHRYFISMSLTFHKTLFMQWMFQSTPINSHKSEPHSLDKQIDTQTAYELANINPTDSKHRDWESNAPKMKMYKGKAKLKRQKKMSIKLLHNKSLVRISRSKLKQHDKLLINKNT